jgi:hypothetical protein
MQSRDKLTALLRALQWIRCPCQHVHCWRHKNITRHMSDAAATERLEYVLQGGSSLSNYGTQPVTNRAGETK